MFIKEKIKVQKDNKRTTITVVGRTREELIGRIEKTINRYLADGYTIR